MLWKSILLPTENFDGKYEKYYFQFNGATDVVDSDWKLEKK